ncbi:MAG: hypothetical protein JSS37_02530 [Proteobacteria bacterium]|nr:hypothetical protein [Pseudomonadota bacterium]
MLKKAIIFGFLFVTSFVAFSAFYFFYQTSDEIGFINKSQREFSSGKRVVLMKDTTPFDWDIVCYIDKYQVLPNPSEIETKKIMGGDVGDEISVPDTASINFSFGLSFVQNEKVKKIFVFRAGGVDINGIHEHRIHVNGKDYPFLVGRQEGSSCLNSDEAALRVTEKKTGCCGVFEEIEFGSFQ